MMLTVPPSPLSDWQHADAPEAKVELLRAIDERYVGAGREIASAG
jgi:hypothetical protein